MIKFNSVKKIYLVFLVCTLILCLMVSSSNRVKDSYRIINVVKHDPINTKENIDKNIIYIKEDVVRSMVKFNTHVVDKNRQKINPKIIVAPSIWKITNKNEVYILQKIN